MPQQLPQIAILPTRTQICGKSSFSINFRISWASWRSVFCFRTRLALISAASPISSSNCHSESSRSNHRACPLASIPTRNFIPCAADQGRISPLPRGAAIAALAVAQSRYLQSNWLEGRVVICSYNSHIGSFSPEPFDCLRHQSLLGSRSRHCHGLNRGGMSNLLEAQGSWRWLRIGFWACTVISVAVVLRRIVALAYPP